MIKTKALQSHYSVVVKIMGGGGLGNQLFQYAYALRLKELGYSVGLDIQTFYQEDNYKPETTFRYYLLDKFQISIPSVNIHKSGYGFILRGFKYQNSLLRKLFKFVFFF
jgi:tellurite resistance protein TehA-like permease